MYDAWRVTLLRETEVMVSFATLWVFMSYLFN